MSRTDPAAPWTGSPPSPGNGTPPASSPTYKDLPPEPPFGPVQPYRQPRPPKRETATTVAGESSGITAGQIALAVGGLLLLLALGIGAALWLLRDDDPADTPLPQETQEESDPFGQFTPQPTNPPQDEDETADGRDPGAQPDPAEPAPTPSAGELTPQDGTEEQPQGGAEEPQGGAEEQPEGEVPQSGDAVPPSGDALPEGGSGELPESAPDGGQAQPAPGQAQPAPDPDDGEVELPLIFELTQLPGGTDETDTTVTQTTADNDDPELEQVTHVDHPDGEITVRALRAVDAADRFEALRTDEAEEVSVQGQTAYLLEGQRLIWLVETDPDTFLSIDGPATVGTDELLTIANGLELQ